jgi:hypothetical protein
VNSAAETRRLEQPGVHLAELVVDVQWTHPVASLDAVGVATWWVSKRRVEAVCVPVLAAIVAGNDNALSKGRLVASIAYDTVALAVLEFVVVRPLVVSATARLYTSAKRKADLGKIVRNYRVLGFTASVNSPFLAVATPSK